MKTMNILEYINSEASQHAEVLRALRESLPDPFTRLVAACAAAVEGGRKIFLFGNGGSAADAQHIAAEFAVRLKKDRKALSALALTTDTSTLTAIGNDFGFENLFSRQVEAHCTSGDVVIGISTSGNSENVVRGLRTATQMGAITAALLGCDGGRINTLVDHSIIVPSNNTARIQEMHSLIGHMLCGAVERKLGLA